MFLVIIFHFFHRQMNQQNALCNKNLVGALPQNLEGQMHVHLIDGIEHLNNTLASLSGGKVGQIKFQFKTPMRESSQDLQFQISWILDNPMICFSYFMKTTIRRIQNKVIKPNLKSPIQFFNSIMKLKINAMKHQLLSLLSAHSNANLQKLIPGLTNKSSSCCISCSIYFTSTYGTRLPTSHEQRNAGA